MKKEKEKISKKKMLDPDFVFFNNQTDQKKKYNYKKKQLTNDEDEVKKKISLSNDFFTGANLSQKEFYNLLVTQFTTLLGGAFSFITALALNDAIQTTINRLIPEEVKKEAITIKFLYAAILLLVVLLLTVLFAWIQKLVALDPVSS